MEGTIRGENQTRDFYPPSGRYQFYDRNTGRDINPEENIVDDVWVDPSTYTYIPELCASAQGSKDYFYSTEKCTRVKDYEAVCKFSKELIITVFGLCKGSPLDLSYSLVKIGPCDNPDNCDRFRRERRDFAGSTGWTLMYSDAKQTWKIISPQFVNMNVTLISPIKAEITLLLIFLSLFLVTGGLPDLGFQIANKWMRNPLVGYCECSDIAHRNLCANFSIQKKSLALVF